MPVKAEIWPRQVVTAIWRGFFCQSEVYITPLAVVKKNRRYPLTTRGACSNVPNMKDENKNSTAAELGKVGGQKTAKRGPEYYAKIQAMRKVRAGGRPPNPRKATHKGILPIGEAGIPCFVLEDGTRVISGRGITRAIGMKGRGQGSARIAALLERKGSHNNELALAIRQPLVFDAGGRIPTQGYEADILVQLCEAILDAREAGLLKTPQEKRYGVACYVLTKALAKVGIIALVDEATGYQEVRDRLALQAILDKFLRKELATWAKRFPDEFYEEMFRLRGWQWKGMKVNRPQVVATYTKDVVYERLAPGILKELEARNPKDERGRRKHRHHQWFTEDVGHPALAQHLYAILGLMRAAASWKDFYAMVKKAFPKKGETLFLPMAEPPR